VIEKNSFGAFASEEAVKSNKTRKRIVKEIFIPPRLLPHLRIFYNNKDSKFNSLGAILCNIIKNIYDGEKKYYVMTTQRKGEQFPSRGNK
jgi:hypothetical protein